MQLQNLLQNLLAVFKNTDNNGVFLLESVAVCLIVQIFKLYVVDKLKIDFTGKFDPVCLLPLVFGVAFAVLNAVAAKVVWLGWSTVYDVLIDGLCIGATSTLMYKTFAAFDKTNLKTLCKDGVFDILYNEILIVTDVKQKLLDKEFTLAEFVAKLKHAASGIKAVYDKDIDGDQDGQNEKQHDEYKRECLKTLLAGFVGDDNLDGVVQVLHRAFKEYFGMK